MRFTLGVIAVIAILTAILMPSYAKVDSAKIHIIGKESVATNDGHEYRVYTDGETYTVGDSWIHPRFNSANVYAHLQIGKTYVCKKYGYRIGFFSSFENLLSCTETN